MTTAARVHWASFAIALALFGLAWGAGDAAVASPSREGAAQTGAIFLGLGEVGLPPSAGPGEGFLSSVLPPEGEEGVERGREEIQVAGPVRRSSRRTARRTSRRQEIIYD
jgi:hypothetical protein